MLSGMATLREKIAAERKVREMLESEGLPPADRIEYGFTCIRLYWDTPMLCLVIDIDDVLPDGPEQVDVFPREG